MTFLTVDRRRTMPAPAPSGGAESALAPSGGAESALARVAWQPWIFADRPRRVDLLGARPEWPCRPARVHVHRNHGFEAVAGALGIFAAYAGWDLAVSLGPYDDSLSWDGLPAADIQVVWLDADRYHDDPSAWLGARLGELRRLTDAPVVVADQAGPGRWAGAVNAALGRCAAELPGVSLLRLGDLAAGLGPAWFDERAAAISGSRLSNAAAIQVARRLGLVDLPALLGTRIKAVVLDLDGTLHDGILGEDGVGGVAVSPERAALQRRLLQLREDGLVLAVATRNDPADVAELLAGGPPGWLLGRHDLADVTAGWDDKAGAVASLAERLGFGFEAIALLDDNPGELAAVAEGCPGVWPIAAADPATALRALDHHPGLARATATEADRRRAADTAAGRRRLDALSASPDPDTYLRSLRAVLQVRLATAADLGRVHQLAARTNQFTTALARPSEREVERYLSGPGRSAVTVALSDRLSDSGTVATVLARRQDDGVVADEIAISCRALGRRLETVMVAAALALVRRELAPDLASPRLHVAWCPGPRNEPARRWIAGAGTVPPAAPALVDLDWPAPPAAGGAVEIEWPGSTTPRPGEPSPDSEEQP